MDRCLLWLRRLAIVSLAPVILFILLAQTTPGTRSLSPPALPPTFTRYLDSLRNADNLEEWLIATIEYLGDKPVERISLLYVAEQSIWRQPRNNDERLAWFDLLTNQGYYELYRGNILRSIEAYEKAYRYYFDRPIPGAAADVLEYVLKPLGNNYTRLGDYDRAFFIHEKSLALALQQNNGQQAAAAYNNLAISARWRGDLDSAQRYVMEGLNTVQKNSPLHGLLLSTAADIYFLLQQWPAAEESVNEAIRILQSNINNKEGDPLYWLLSAWQVHGNILKEKGEWEEALLSYSTAAKIADEYFKGQRNREKAKLYVLSGITLLQLQRPGEAAAQFNNALALLVPGWQAPTVEALPPAGDLYGENTLLDALNGKAAALLALGKKEKALDCFMLLFTVERRLRYEFFSSTAKQQQQKENRQWAETAIETAYQLWKASGRKEYAHSVLLIAEMSKAQLLLDEMISNLQYNRLKNRDTLLDKQQQLMHAINFYEKEAMLNRAPGKRDSAVTVKKELQYELSFVQKQVKEKYPALAGYMMTEQMFSTDSLLNSIPVNTNVIEFFSSEKGIYSIHAKKGIVQHIRKLENAAQVQQALKDFVFTYFQQGPEKMMNEPEQYYKDAHTIYQWLWEERTDPKQDHFIVVPDGIIGYLPFDALITDSIYKANIDQWPFLAKQTNLFFSYSLQTWQQQQEAVQGNKTFAGFFISFDSSTNAAIPAVKREYASVKQVVQGEFFADTEASLKTFQQQLGEANLLHISTHSFLQGNEKIPVLQLADERFFLFELYGQSFQPQLIVLSACRTGHGMLAEGEGIISLARGFTATGAGGIVAGLWNMNDESTATLMGKFYAQLLKNNRPADALYLAKKEWLLQDHPQSFKKLPYFWAGMIYAGNNQPVLLPEKNAAVSVWMIVAACIVLSLIYAWWIRSKKRMAA